MQLKKTLVFTFSEPVTSADFNGEVLIKDADGAVLGYANLGGDSTATAVTNTMVVLLKAVAGNDILDLLDQGTNDIKVSIPNGSTIKDANNNIIAPLADTATTITVDTVGPVVSSSVLAADDKTLTITFNEAITNNTADAAALKAAVTTATDAATWVALNAADTVTISGSTLVIVFNTPLAADTQDIKIAASALKDATGNATLAITIANIIATTN